MNKNELICNLYDIGAIKVGDFTLASGLKSPIYIDLRTVISHPLLLKMVADEVWGAITSAQVELLCGVPYSGLPIATTISVTKDVPLILVRKELKQHGTKKEVEGVFHANQACVLIEDLVTTGGSVLKVAEMLRKNGLQVNDVAVLVDRGQGAHETLKEQGVNLHAVITAKEMFTVLKDENRLTKDEYDKIAEFLG